jgi:Zn-dependent protease with chaperone function
MIEMLLAAGLRSLLLAALTGALLSAFRVRNAAIRHSCWTAVVVATFLMPLLTTTVPRLDLALLPPAEAPAGTLAQVSPIPSIAAPAVGNAPPETRVLRVYALVALALLLRWGVGYGLGVRLLRSARRVEGTPFPAVPRVRCLESDRISVPVTFGWLRPKILLPSGFRAWSRPKLEAVIAHETAHVRRHDFAIRSLATLTWSVFWFSPLAWWLEWRLSTLAEQAADDMASGAAPREYAGILVGLASGIRPIRMHGLAVVERGSLHARVDRLLDQRYAETREPNRRMRGILVASVIAMTAFSAAVMLTETGARAGTVVGPAVQIRQGTPAPGAQAESESEPSVEPPAETPRLIRSRELFFALWNAQIAAGRGQSPPAQPGPQPGPGPDPQDAGAPEEPAEVEEAVDPESLPSPGADQISPPQVRSRVFPEYTEEARRARQQGSVVLDTIIRR